MFSVLVSDLKKALTAIKESTGKGQLVPHEKYVEIEIKSLSHMLLKASDNISNSFASVQISKNTNSELGLILPMVSYSMLSNIVSTLDPTSTIGIYYDKNALTIKSANQKPIKINGIVSPKPFIQGQNVSITEVVEVSDLLSGFNALSDFITQNDATPIFNSINVSFEYSSDITVLSHRISFEMIDSKNSRLGFYSKEYTGNLNQSFSFFIDAVKMKSFLRHLDPSHPAFLYVYDNAVELKQPDYEFAICFYSGNFPKCKEMFPSQSSSQIVVDKLTLLNTLERIKILSEGGMASTQMEATIKNSSICLEYESEHGNLSEVLPVIHTGATDFIVRFNLSSIIASAKKISDSHILWSFPPVNASILSYASSTNGEEFKLLLPSSYTSIVVPSKSIDEEETTPEDSPEETEADTAEEDIQEELSETA